MKRILVCGGRDYGKIDPRRPLEHPKKMAERKRLRRVLDELFLDFGPFVVIHGGARGADALAGAWVADFAGANLPEPRVFEADWNDLSHPDAVIKIAKGGTNKGRQYDALAGHRRNQKMLDEGKPDLVVAFPGGTGTADMIDRARKANVEIMEIDK